ncbi:endospore germination permease [Bacillus sp. FJAT-47783]|uniref:GerAB/ArcD/ProY family transporter n=1 Tax=Bacillus sp. FJAT-47783 TaxID=2922712 RepID=UPI001FABF6BE|nr:endospore germination permease [Bacillus sp. FJAT-47783]
MIEKGKISAFQLAIMMFPTIVGTAIIGVPTVTGKFAKNDLWLSPIWASITGVVAVYIAFQLHKFYPKQTIIQYSEQIAGRFVGKILGLLFLFFYILMNGQSIRIYADFIVGATLYNTPISIVIATMILICTFATRAGLEVLGRMGQLFFPVFTFPLIIMIIFLIPDLDVRNIFPIMEHGLLPSIKGAYVPQAWFAEFFLISFLIPFVTDKDKGLKWMGISIFSVMISFVIVNLLILFFIGEIGAKDNNYPLLMAARYIGVAGFFENLESVAISVWVLGNFVKFSAVHYCIVLGTAQWLNLSDYRPIVFPLGMLTMVFSFWGMPSQIDIIHYLVLTGFPLYSLLIQTIIPLLLLGIAIVRKGKMKKRET